MPNMNKIKTVCVYCGSGPGTNPRFVEAAIALGKILAENGIRLVYGGGSIGLMGAVATSVLDHGGTVTGIIPDFLTARENALTRIQEMIVTPDMHERKRLMFERSDAFVALPGGIGPLQGGSEAVLFFVGVDDVEATLKRAEELGGRTVQPATSVPGVTFGVMSDTQGHLVGLAAQT